MVIVTCEQCGAEVEAGNTQRRFCAACRAERYRKCHAESTQRWYVANRERHIEASKRWHRENKSRHAANQRRWAAAHPDIVRQSRKQWQGRNPERVHADYLRYRTLLRNAPGHYTRREFRVLVEAAGGACYYCGAKPRRLTADHRIPLSRGGSNSISNIVPACHSCNSSKGAMTDEEYVRWLCVDGFDGVEAA